MAALFKPKPATAIEPKARVVITPIYRWVIPTGAERVGTLATTIYRDGRTVSVYTPLPVTLDPEAVASGAIIPPDGARDDGTGQHGSEPSRDDGTVTGGKDGQ